MIVVQVFYDEALLLVHGQKDLLGCGVTVSSMALQVLEFRRLDSVEELQGKENTWREVRPTIPEEFGRIYVPFIACMICL
jgi:hypothetical protein